MQGSLQQERLAIQLIANYGLFWRRDQVTATTQADTLPPIASGEWPRFGELLGVGVRKKRQGVVDFATQRGIYALYDDQFRLIYVGQTGRNTGRLYRRLRTHSRSVLSERWSRFSWFGIMPVVQEENADTGLGLIEVPDDDERRVKRSTILDHLEAVLILAGEPVRNKQGGRFGQGVTHYRQYRGAFDENEATEQTDED